MYIEKPTTPEFFKPYEDIESSTINDSKYVKITNVSSNNLFAHVLHPRHKLGWIQGKITHVTHNNGKTQCIINEAKNLLSNAPYLTIFGSTKNEGISDSHKLGGVYIATGERNGKYFFEGQGPEVIYYEPNAFLDGGAWIIVSKLDNRVFGKSTKKATKVEAETYTYDFWYKTNDDLKYPNISGNWSSNSSQSAQNNTITSTFHTSGAGSATLNTQNVDKSFWVHPNGTDLKESFIVYLKQTYTKHYGFNTNWMTNNHQWVSDPYDNWQDETNPRHYYIGPNNRWEDTILMQDEWMVRYKRNTYPQGFGTSDTVYMARKAMGSTGESMPTSGWTGSNFTFVANPLLDTSTAPKTGMRIYTKDGNLQDPYQDAFIESVTDNGNNNYSLEFDKTVSSLIARDTSDVRIGYQITPRIISSIAIPKSCSITIEKEPHEEVAISPGPTAIGTVVGSPALLQPVKKPILI
jgi:hypothetical protein|tara:strand:+ start:1220 stop:2611 length:1392 start_codon:yes stop_codon:yes gene_type:complete